MYVAWLMGRLQFNSFVINLHAAGLISFLLLFGTVKPVLEGGKGKGLYIEKACWNR